MNDTSHVAAPSSPAKSVLPAQPPATPSKRIAYLATKRLLDTAAATVGVILVSPLFLAVAIAIKFDSPGPVFFRQERMGRRFRPFRIFKFRTMTVDAASRGGELTTGNDQRITRVGNWLRRSKIDEFPQLFNVLKGDMALVGPRPEVPRYVERFRDDFAYILSMRPGITDVASLKYRDESALFDGSADPEQRYIEQILPDKLALSKQYVDEASLWYDARLLAKTFFDVWR